MAAPPSPNYSTFKHITTTIPASPSIPGVALLTISRPSKLNAFTPAMWAELPPLFQTLSHDPSIQSIVLTGSGHRAFTTGLDVQSSFTSSPLAYMINPSASSPPDAARIAHELRHFILSAQRCLSSVAECSKPVIMALHGFCFGLGIDLSLCGDIRICSPSTKFSVKEVDIGIAADLGTLTRLPKVVGSASWVKDICLTGRVWGAQEALTQGYVSEIATIPPSEATTEPSGFAEGAKEKSMQQEKEAVLARALELASTIASKSPVAVQGTKELLDWSWDRSVEDGLRYTAAWNAGMVQTKDVIEAVRAGREGRKGRFSKL